MLLLLAASPAFIRAQAEPGSGPAAQPASAFIDGRWEGVVDFGGGEEELALRLFSADPETGAPAGALVDLPARQAYGLRAEVLDRRPSGLDFSLRGAVPLGGVAMLEARRAPPPGGAAAAVPAAPIELSGSAGLVPLPDPDEEGSLPAVEGRFRLS